MIIVACVCVCCCHTCQIRVTWFRASGLYIISTVVQFGGAHMNNHAFAAITHTLSILTASSCHKTVVRNMKTLIWMKVVYPPYQTVPQCPSQYLSPAQHPNHQKGSTTPHQVTSRLQHWASPTLASGTM